MYKQVIHLDRPPYKFMGDWQKWRVNIGNNGIPYLYLYNFRYCAVDSTYSCEWLNDGSIGWSDCCGDGSIEQPLSGETILTIVGPPSYTTPTGTQSDIWLILFRGCENSAWEYKFQEP